MTETHAYVGRGGLKLEAALDHYELSVEGLDCADLGSNVGGFVDCLLQRGARSVISVDTSYGTLAWKLRQDERVIVRERSNAMHVEFDDPVALISIDLGWTPQAKILPHARTLLQPGGRIVTLIKPQYESHEDERHKGVVKTECLDEVLQRCCQSIRDMGFDFESPLLSPIKGGGGNQEFLLALREAGS